jgi:hypothetical protein
LFVANQPLPPYSYVPGKFPHPIRDPGGHSFGEEPVVVNDCDSRDWRDCIAYLRGVDLFNNGFYWESHESWEAVWNGFGRVGLEADFMKALIKLAAALVKAREGRSAGVARHATRAEELLVSVQEQQGSESQSMMGLSFEVLISYAQSMRAEPDQLVNTSDEPVVCFGAFVLHPE